MPEYGKERCNCGHKACRDWWLTGIGKFNQGSGFTEHEADLIIAALTTRDLIAKRTEEFGRELDQLAGEIQYGQQ